MMPSRLARVVLAAILAAAWSAAFARVYKWTDETGTPMYSNAAPPRSAKHVEVVIEDDPRGAAEALAAQDERRREELMQERIYSL